MLVLGVELGEEEAGVLLEGLQQHPYGQGPVVLGHGVHALFNTHTERERERETEERERREKRERKKDRKKEEKREEKKRKI